MSLEFGNQIDRGEGTRKPVPVAVEPGRCPDWLGLAIREAGGQLTELEQAEALVWLGGEPNALRRLLTEHPQIQWVQLQAAGTDDFTSVFDTKRIWTSAKGAYSRAIAEHALALALAIARGLPEDVVATSWIPRERASLFQSQVLLVGGGGVAQALAELLRPFEPRLIAVRRTSAPMPGADETLQSSELHRAIPEADLIFLTLALTEDTVGVISQREFALMRDSAILVNVARGKHIVTDDLVDALDADVLFGAGLDVTDPEPLPAGHRLWHMHNCIITSHSANPSYALRHSLGQRVRENVRRFSHNAPLIGVIDVTAGY